MVDSVITLPFTFAAHGYATARNNEEMKAAFNIMMVVPILSDFVFGDTKGYSDIASIPIEKTLIMVLIAIGIIEVPWLIGYAIGSWRN